MWRTLVSICRPFNGPLCLDLNFHLCPFQYLLDLSSLTSLDAKWHPWNVTVILIGWKYQNVIKCFHFWPTSKSIPTWLPKAFKLVHVSITRWMPNYVGLLKYVQKVKYDLNFILGVVNATSVLMQGKVIMPNSYGEVKLGGIVASWALASVNLCTSMQILDVTPNSPTCALQNHNANY